MTQLQISVPHIWPTPTLERQARQLRERSALAGKRPKTVSPLTFAEGLLLSDIEEELATRTPKRRAA
jgi:hypothetical protein